jgi:hypothetical protein
VTCHSLHIRCEDPLGPRGVPKPHRADDGVLCGTQARDLVDYGIPVPFDPNYDLAQTRLVLRPPADAALVEAPRLPQVVVVSPSEAGAFSARLPEGAVP